MRSNAVLAYEADTFSAGELWSRYLQAEAHSAALFAEQRSNLLLVSGQHYTNANSKFGRTLREIESVTKTQKLRLTKNHLQRITKTYRNTLLQYAPRAGVTPRNDTELSDVKVAEMHQSVWADMSERNLFTQKTRKWAQDFVDIGECIAKVFFDEQAGHFLGYDPLYDDMGQPILDEEGKPMYGDDSQAVWTGDVVFERILGFNLLVDPDARSWEEARWVIYRKMVPIAELRKLYKDDPSKMAWITSSSEETWKIFDSSTGTYRDGDGLVMVTEHYYRPQAGMENGYYYIMVHSGILHEGELPLGLFPIVYAGFDEAATSARSFSIIKQLRPYQSEINRCASKIAEHQITLGDDKVILANGATMSPGGTAHGLKAIHVTGATPTVFAGRTGEQYLGYMQSQVSEMYQVAHVDEVTKEETSGQIDPYAILYKTAKQKRPFMLYIQKFEEFLVTICKLALRFAKAFYSDEMLIPVVGKSEYINIEEFRSSDDLGYQIKVEAETEDLESKMGKQLTLNHLVQYAAGSLDKRDLGQVLSAMPYGNDKLALGDLTQDWRNWVNDSLAMDRGRFVEPRRGEDHDYVIKKINGRMKERSFDLLPPQVKQQWEQKLVMHEQLKAQQVMEQQRLQQGLIPTGGYLCTVDLYVAGPDGKQERVRLPSETVQWAMEQIKIQGTTQELLAGQDIDTQNRIMASAAQMHAAQQQQPMPVPMPARAA